MHFHKILVRPFQSITVVLHLLIINALHSIYLGDIKQLFLQLDNFANHLTILLEYLILLYVFGFILIGHAIGNIYFDLILHFVL